jgi:hypothetical protein
MKTLYLNNKELVFSAQFSSIETQLSLVQYYQCELLGNGDISKGYSEGFFASSIRTKSFSEAWERWWLNHISLLPFEINTTPASSNGFAAHKTIELAKKNSRLELLERRDIILSWQKSGIWKRLNQNSIISFIQSIVEFSTKNKNWKIEFYQIISDGSHITVIGLLVHISGGILFDSAAIDTEINFKTLIKVALSLLRSIPFVDFDKVVQKTVMPKIALPRDHLAFYFNSENSRAFDIHRKNSGSGISLIQDANGITSFELLNVDGFPALAYSCHKNWEDISWGSGSHQINGWPHPIA